MTWYTQPPWAIQNWARRPLVLAAVLLLLVLPRSAYGHSVLPPTDQTLAILEDTASGPYRITASQYIANDFLVVEVQVAVNGSELPIATRAEATITAAQAGESITKRLLRHHDTFIARLPLADEPLQISLSIEGTVGQGHVEIRTISYTARQAATPLVRGVVIGIPFLLILGAIVLYRYFGLAFVQ